MSQTVSKAVDILYFVAESPSGRSLTEIATAMGMNKATAFRLAQTLTKRELFRHDGVNRRYFAGSGLFRLASLVQSHERVRDVALGPMYELRDMTRETVSLSIARGVERQMIELLPALHELRYVEPRYNAKPIHCGAQGKALLAFQPEREIEKVIRETGLKRVAAGTITSPEDLRRDLAEIRRKGYATSIEETVPGCSAVAAPVFDPSGEAVAAICIHGPCFRFTQKLFKRYGNLVLATTGRVTAEMGGSVSDESRDPGWRATA